MNANENKILRTLYKKGKAISEPPVFEALLYSISDILNEANVERETIIQFLDTSNYITWVKPEGIKLSADGLVYCQEEFERKPLGFLNLSDKENKQ